MPLGNRGFFIVLRCFFKSAPAWNAPSGETMQVELAAHRLMRKCVADESRGEPTLYLGKV